MEKHKSFFVNLKSEDTKMLKRKLNWIIDEMESRIIKSEDITEKNIIRAKSKPRKEEMSKVEILNNVKRWKTNGNLKIHMCLNFFQNNNWTVSNEKFDEFCKTSLHVKKPNLFLLSLTKKPYIREWTNIEDQKRKSRDYGDIFLLDETTIILNKKYSKEIRAIWEGETK